MTEWMKESLQRRSRGLKNDTPNEHVAHIIADWCISGVAKRGGNNIMSTDETIHRIVHLVQQ